MKILSFFLVAALWCQCARAQYGPDPEGVPADFLCGWRRLAYDYSNQLRPDAAALVYDALEIGRFCNGTVKRPSESALPRAFPPSFTPVLLTGSSLYVDGTNGDDSNPGTSAKPLKTLSAGVALARASEGLNTVVMRAGTYYLAQPVELESADSGLTISNYPGEEVWLSGAMLLTGLEWTPSSVTNSATAANVWQADLSHFDLDSAGIPEMRMNGRRLTQARYPNADPEVDFWPKGYLTSKDEFAPAGDWLEPTIQPQPNTALLVNVSSPNREWDDDFSHYTGGINGTCSIYDPPFSYWCQSEFSEGCGACFTWNIPSGLLFHDQLRNYTTNPTDMQVFAWRAKHWANWMFDVKEFNMENRSITFGRGGFQGARGGPGSDWFISNVLEELDSVGEFYFDRQKKVLYVQSNSTAGQPPSASTVFEAVQQPSLIVARGTSMQDPLKDLTIQGIGFRDTAPTFMEPHGVPSGGDWALERLGVVLAENTEGLTVSGIKMWRCSGNGVMLSKYNQYARVINSEFAWQGSTAVAAWGFTDEISDGGIHGVDGTDGNFPRYTLIEGNLFREIGTWEKQSSAFFQAKAAQTLIKGNVVFNLARAGFNFNDGFGGGDNITQNLLFNTCRESSDHGPINSWDRQPYLTTVRTGQPSMQMEWRDVWSNFVVANYGGSKEVDNDDGSLFWRIHHNYMQYGWAQKFKCGGIESYGNYKAFVDIGGKFDAGCTTGAGFPNLWHNDTMIVLPSTTNFAYRQCWSTPDQDWDKTQVFNNTLILANAAIDATIKCGRDTFALPDFVAKGMGDFGSRQLVGWTKTETIVSEIRNVLGSWS